MTPASPAINGNWTPEQDREYRAYIEKQKGAREQRAPVYPVNPPVTEARRDRDNRAAKPRFLVEKWCEIQFDGREEWAVKRLLPAKGLAAVYGKPESLKSFVVADIALAVALGREWAGRRVKQASVVYIAAEGAGGLRKRKAGMTLANSDIPPDLPFAMISAAPNLGVAGGDLPELVAAIDGAGMKPGLIVLDTLAQSLGGGDENGAGMTALVMNARALSDRFACLVLIVHHCGLGDDRRMRGHSSLHGALDAQILCEREEGQLAATLALQKLKDDASDVQLVATLSRIVVGHDEDDEEISTLVVDSVQDAEPRAETPKAKSVPPSQRLLMAIMGEALADCGEDMRPFHDGPIVRAVADIIVRDRYYSRIAEQAEPGEEAKKLAARQRQAFNRAVEAALKAQTLVAAEHRGARVLWLP